MQNAMLKSCSCCPQPAQYSLVFVLSTIGVSPRRQKCSKAVLFCADCAAQLCKAEHWMTVELREAVNSAYIGVNRLADKHLQAEASVND